MGLFVVEGFKSIEELASSSMEPERIYCVETTAHLIPQNLQEKAVQISTKSMDRISQMKTPPGILATVRIPEYDINKTLEETRQAPLPFAIVAAGISDPGNLGTIIRTADWFGIRSIWLSPGTTDPWNLKCVQASMGSVFRIPICAIPEHDPTLSQAFDSHYALELSGQSYTECQWKAGAIWVGSEANGFQDQNLPAGIKPINIPGAGHAESLNAAISNAIVVSEIARKYKS